MKENHIIRKGIRKIRGRALSFLRKRGMDVFFYPSYWHSVLKKNPSEDLSSLYFAAKPNAGAGIGHQMANWISGYWFSQYFKLGFAHCPFPSEKWEQFLGFYQEEKTFEELKKSGYKVVRIPLFREENPKEVERTDRIIASYGGKKVVFLAEQDQFYREQCGVKEALAKKFHAAPIRQTEKLIYKKDDFNIAIHVRRGDIVQTENKNQNLTMRFQQNDYFINALESVLKRFQKKENIKIYLFSQGKKEDYPEFSKYPNLQFCLDMDAQQSFLHMVYADVLITSKSSFSYKPALLSKGVKVCPKEFWHGYPEETDWILLDEEGIPVHA